MGRELRDGHGAVLRGELGGLVVRRDVDAVVQGGLLLLLVLLHSLFLHPAVHLGGFVLGLGRLGAVPLRLSRVPVCRLFRVGGGRLIFLVVSLNTGTRVSVARVLD